MIRSSVGSFFLLVLLAALSAFPALAAPQSGPYRASHSPYKDYGSGHPHKRLAVPDGVDSCALSAGELLDPGDQELVSDGIRYSEVCLEQFAFTLVPEERADCRSECPTCTTVRGYDMGCVTERVIRRSSEVDLTQLRDTTQPPRLMYPTAASDCVVPPENTSIAWSPFTVVGTQFFDNDCLTRLYLDALSSAAPCPLDDNTCMIDRALELQDAIGSAAVSER